MSGDVPADEGQPAQGSPETVWHGEKPNPPEPVAALHEDATILGSLDVHRPGADPSDDRASGVADLPELRRVLIQIGLIEETELDVLATHVPESQGVLGLARFLQQAGRLTAYQAAAIYQRKSRGLLIGNYLILEKLGAGGMGMVFKARHRKLGRVVALKILPPSFARDRNAVLRFKREVEAAGRLKHPNIVAALDADEDRGVHFLVMEYVEGSDLDRVVRHRGQLPLGQAVDFLIQAARGLEAAHAQGIVHRDIKPSNLMLDGAGTVRVLDLGLARIVDASNPFGQAAGARLTESGMYMGTVDYMAPEQAEDSKSADHRADIYSLGCTFYFLLTGREPFVGETVLKRLMAHMERPAPMLRAVRPDVLTGVEDVYQRMMAKRPAERPESMTEVIRLLEMCQAAIAEAPQTVGGAPKSSPKLMVFDEGRRKTEKGQATPRTDRDVRVFAEGDKGEGLLVGSEFSLDDLEMDVRLEPPLGPPPIPTTRRAAKRPAVAATRTVRGQSGPGGWTSPFKIAVSLAGVALIGGFLGFLLISRRPTATPSLAPPRPIGQVLVDPPPPTPLAARTIFDGRSPKGWILSNLGHTPLPARHVQPDGLNPHGTGSYLVAYEQKVGDFVLDFDYKLTADCNSGVFLRVGDLNDPPNTGIEVEVVDKPVRPFREPGAFCDLVPAAPLAQKPTGEWNHMTITAQGPEISVTLNGRDVSRINLDEWTVPGKRPDGTGHKFEDVAFAKLSRSGYIGFQDLKGDCWFKDIHLLTRMNPLDRSEAIR
jgi:serine/threonine protein kinase